MSFRPSLHGWPFANVRSCEPSTLGIGAPPLPELGLGGGMCWSALDRFLAGVTIRRRVTAPEPGEPLYEELVRRQVAALSGVWVRVREWQASADGSWRDRIPFPPRIPGRDLASRTRAIWPRLRRQLDRGQPVLLTVMPESDPYVRSHAAWQVLAYDWSRVGSRVALSVYDPDRPGDDGFLLAFSLVGPLEARFTGGLRVRGFFPVRYDRPRPEALRGESFGDHSVIGLNRKVSGGLGAASAGPRLDVLGRNEAGALLHFRRGRDRRWHGADVTGKEQLGTFELHGDPVALAAGRKLHVFGRNHVGDLLHFRLGRGWKVVNRTDHKRAGARFRIKGAPTALLGPLGGLAVIARNRDGTVIHYTGQPFLAWSAEDVPTLAPLGSDQDPVAVRSEKTLHVLGVAADGRLLHSERREDRWRPVDVDAERRDEPTLRMAGRPAVSLRGEVLLAFGRTAEGDLVGLERCPGDRWRGRILAEGIGGDPVVVAGPSGVHVFAAGRDGGLIHVWGDEDWDAEDIVAGRPSIPVRGPLAGELVAWGSDRELRVFARHDRELVLFRWDPAADWTAEEVRAHTGIAERHRPAEVPLLVEHQGRPHLLATDGRGTLIHIETVGWREPASRKRRGRPAPATIAAPRPAPASPPDPRPLPEPPEPPPLPLLDERPPERPTPAQAQEEPLTGLDRKPVLPARDDSKPARKERPPAEIPKSRPKRPAPPVRPHRRPVTEPDPLPLLEDPTDEAESRDPEPLPLVWPEDDLPIEQAHTPKPGPAPPSGPSDADDDDDDLLEIGPMDLSLLDAGLEGGNGSEADRDHGSGRRGRKRPG